MIWIQEYRQHIECTTYFARIQWIQFRIQFIQNFGGRTFRKVSAMENWKMHWHSKLWPPRYGQTKLCSYTYVAHCWIMNCTFDSNDLDCIVVNGRNTKQNKNKKKLINSTKYELEYRNIIENRGGQKRKICKMTRTVVRCACSWLGYSRKITI